MITTRISNLFGLEYPIMSAPMTMHSGGTLAAAVSRIGALGSFGGLHAHRGTDWLVNEIDHIRQTTDRPFGIGFITEFIPHMQSFFEAALESRPAVIARSFGNPEPWLTRAKTYGGWPSSWPGSVRACRERARQGPPACDSAGRHDGHIRKGIPQSIRPAMAHSGERTAKLSRRGGVGLQSGAPAAGPRGHIAANGPVRCVRPGDPPGGGRCARHLRCRRTASPGTSAAAPEIALRLAPPGCGSLR